MSAPIVTPNLTDKLPEQMTQDELVQKSNEVRAQVAATPASVPAPAADDVAGLPPGAPAPTPQLPEGFSEYELRADGTLHTKLVTGEVFDGQPLEVTQKLAASKVATNRSYLEAKGKLEAIPPSAPAADAAVVEQREQIAATLSSLPPDQFAELYYQKLNDPAEATAMAMARSLGYDNADEMKQDFIDMKATSEVQRATQIAATFERDCPEYPFTDGARDKLYEVLQENNMKETLGNLKLAHAYCIQNKLYVPRTPEEIAAGRGAAKPATVTVPPPMLPPQNAAPVTTNFANMTSDQIAAEYQKIKYSTQ